MCAVVACSPTVYEDQVQSFDRSVQGTRTLLNEYRQLDTDSRTERRVVEVVGRRLRIEPSEACESILDMAVLQFPQAQTLQDYQRIISTLVAQSGQCTLDEEGHQDNALFNPGRTNADEIMALLADYAKGLGSIASAKTSESLTAAANGVQSAVVGLVTRLAPQGGSLATESGPFTMAMETLGSAYFDQQRYSALKTAVTRLEPLMPSIVEVLSAYAVGLHVDVLHQRFVTLDVRATSFDTAPLEVRQELTTRLYRDFDALHDLMRRDPTQVFKSMKEPHTALATALATPVTQLEPLVRAIAHFGENVQAMSQAVEKVHQSGRNAN